VTRPARVTVGAGGRVPSRRSGARSTVRRTITRVTTFDTDVIGNGNFLTGLCPFRYEDSDRADGRGVQMSAAAGGTTLEGPGIGC
jgi:hypothetical protein